jgi:hypothetical protein
MKYFLSLLLILLNFCSFGQTKPKAKKLERSVVLVKCYDENRVQIAWGSGVIIDAKGTCITNYHVVKNAYFVRIKTQEGLEFDMDKITGQSEMRDLVRFTIKNSNTTFTPVVLCKKIPEKGDDVWAMGTPVTMDNMNAFTHGEISNIKIDYRFVGDTVLQINNAIAHGSSGGGLFNSNSELVGITSAGREDEDGARAAMNYAIYAREILELERVNKDRLESAVRATTNKTEQEYRPAPELPKYEPPKYEQPKQVEVPKYGSVSFYTDWSQPIEISIDWNYGTTHQYFSSGKPRCGQDGTVNFSLRPGTYNYTAKGEVPRLWGSVEYSWNGSVTVRADGCEQVFLSKPEKGKDKDAKFAGKNLVLGTDFTHGIYINKYFSNQKYSCQALYYNFRNTPGNGYEYNSNKYGIDVYRVLSTKNNSIDFNFHFGPSIRYLNGSFSGDTNFFKSLKGEMKMNQWFFNVRAGVECILFDRIVLHGNIGYGYATEGWGLNAPQQNLAIDNTRRQFFDALKKPGFATDYDVYVGYKFGIRNTNNSTFLKYAPQLILPGWTDHKLSSGKKGKLKMGLFISSAAVAIGSKIYSNSEYRRYTTNSDFNTTHYNNANISNKIFLASSGVGASLYVFDIVHFFTKLKEIKH